MRHQFFRAALAVVGSIAIVGQSNADTMRKRDDNYNIMLRDCLKWVPEMSMEEKEDIINGSLEGPINPQAFRCVNIVNNPRFKLEP